MSLLLHQFDGGIIRDAEVASAIGRVILTGLYGADEVAPQEPLAAMLDGDLWVVSGNAVGKQLATVVKLARADCAVVEVNAPLQIESI